MIDIINKNQGVISFLAIIISLVTYFLTGQKLWVFAVLVAVILILSVLLFWEKKRHKSFVDTQKKARILFIDDKHCEIVTNLRRNDFEVRKIDDVTSPATDTDVQWANIIFVDYKDVGKKLFGKKEGLGLISELKRTYMNNKRYVIYSSVQDFDGLVEFPYIRKNASYDEFVSLISTELAKL